MNLAGAGSRKTKQARVMEAGPAQQSCQHLVQKADFRLLPGLNSEDV